jgi:hypothetical protein
LRKIRLERELIVPENQILIHPRDRGFHRPDMVEAVRRPDPQRIVVNRDLIAAREAGQPAAEELDGEPVGILLREENGRRGQQDKNHRDQDSDAAACLSIHDSS